MKKAFLLGGILLGLAACSDPDTATEVLRDTGYTEITITGYTLFGCAKDDTYHTGFVARGQGGVMLRGVVCSEWSPFGKTNSIHLYGRAS